jgi:2-C-methyl-D-erythritol 4-phosphate cytidylyltransferase
MRGDVGVVIPAAGAGARMGGAKKAFLELDGAPLLQHVLRVFLAHARVAAIAVALPSEESGAPPEWLTAMVGESRRITIVSGGRERSDSVRAGLRALPESLGIILVHDAARPLVDRDLIDRILAAVHEGQGAVPGLPLVDTVKEVDSREHIVGTPVRHMLRRVQTPQGFPAALLRDAYERATRDGTLATDDAALVERYGGRVIVVPGTERNLKITTPLDLAMANAMLAEGL